MWQKYKHQFHYNPLSVLHHIAGTHHDFAIEAAKIGLLTVDKYVLGHRAKLIGNECIWEQHDNLQPSLLYTNTQNRISAMEYVHK
jgi:hypothetical protein